MPVSIAPINRQPGTMPIKLRLQRGDEFPILLVDRTAAAEMIIVLGHGQHSFARNILSPQDIFEEGNNLLVRFWTPKRHHQQRVIVHIFRLCLDLSQEDKFGSGFQSNISAWEKNWREDFYVLNCQRKG